MESELEAAATTRKELDGPTQEEKEKEEAERMKLMTKHVDDTLGLMREAMIGSNWEASAVQHEAEYQSWRSQRNGGGQPDAPLGQWYVTHVLMPQLAAAMLHGQVGHMAPATAGTNAPQLTEERKGEHTGLSQCSGARRGRSPAVSRLDRQTAKHPRSRSQIYEKDGNNPNEEAHWGHLKP